MARKLFITVIILWYATGALAQNLVIKGTVLDIADSTPLGYATISTEDSHYTTISNNEGTFVLSCPAGTKNITISYLGFAPLIVNTSKLPADGNYYMEKKDTELEEVVIMNTPIRDFLEKLINNSIEQQANPIVLSTYYREFVNYNGTYSKFADGLIDYSLKNKNQDIKTDIIVKQSRAAKLKESDEDNAIKVIAFDVRKTVDVNCNFLFLQGILIKKKSYKDYDFIFKSLPEANGTQLQKFTFTPKKGVEKSLFTGTVVYDPDKNLIMNIDLRMAPDYIKYEKVSNRIIVKLITRDFNYKSAFRFTDGKYLLSYASMYVKARAWNRFGYDNTYAFKSDLIVTNSTTDLSDFNKKYTFNEFNLYDRGNNYTEKFWLKNNSIVLTDEEEQIIKDLENKQ